MFNDRGEHEHRSRLEVRKLISLAFAVMTDIALLLLLLGNFLNLILGTTYYNNISDADDDSHIYRKTTLFNLRNLKSFKFDYGKLNGAENY